jgi:hypothetical protein
LLCQHPHPLSVDHKNIFKLEEEGMLALLLHLLKLFAETTDFSSATGLGCWLVVGFLQPSADETAIFWFTVI